MRGCRKGNNSWRPLNSYLNICAHFHAITWKMVEEICAFESCYPKNVRFSVIFWLLEGKDVVEEILWTACVVLNLTDTDWWITRQRRVEVTSYSNKHGMRSMLTGESLFYPSVDIVESVVAGEGKQNQPLTFLQQKKCW